MKLLVLAEHHQGQLAAATAKVVAAARQIADCQQDANAEIDVLVAGLQVTEVAQDAAGIEGVSRVLLADSSVLDHQLAEPMGELLVTLADGYTHVLAAASTTGKNVLPRLAALKDVAQLSEIVAVIDEDTFKRPIYAGNAIATVQSLDPIKVITVRVTAFEAAGKRDQTAPVSVLPVTAHNEHSLFVSESQAASDRPELGSARVVISGGRGMGSGDNFALLDGIADALGGAIGASRAAVDAGYVANDLQVGQTGKIVAPELYIAVGISGAIQHLAGMKDSKVIVAINKDEEAPIFQVADYGLVADLFQALPELESALQRR
ncbi:MULTISPECIES: electron transfer flavoprotein subunit alpha/FixB family protein [unclassified Halomonas]|uniref:electron transfer flavoprotein subunit alpha/FixB family protein n=1 Tax=unclassified Halomonas TaxID=2609666 RepID=UPI001C972965|nr:MULTISPECIES: FAD-binding protein [unclassified Halomonas]MBY5927367.1 FAD-binding protein [Halomonas sp. DP4Y7-2]MBY6234408.1 FAD-binding protein [Halomonas sp. DP4Y7-1]